LISKARTKGINVNELVTALADLKAKMKGMEELWRKSKENEQGCRG